jgi:predicted DNA binding CopG/RHH family protein
MEEHIDMKKKKTVESVLVYKRDAKTTLRLPQALWDAARHRAIDEGVPVQTIVENALRAYLGVKL